MKKTTVFLLALSLVLMLALPVSAHNELGYVTDSVGILTQEEYEELELQAIDLADRHDFGVYVIVLDDFQNYVATTDIREAARSIYNEYGLGRGADRDGILLLLSLEGRDYALRAMGYGSTAFTDYGKQYLSEEFLDDFADDRWADGFADYLRVSDEMLAAAENGNPVDEGNVPGGRMYGIIACILLGFGVAFIVRGSLKGQLKSVAMGTGAAAFQADGGLVLTQEYDRYTHTTQDRVYSPEKTESGGTTTDREGGSDQSGKF